MVVPAAVGSSPGEAVFYAADSDMMNRLGAPNDEIADRLTISKATAKTHVSRVMGKLDARYRAQLVVFAYEFGLVMPGRVSR